MFHVTSCKATYIRKVYACLAVTCHLHFWQNDRDLLRATAVTRGWNGYRNKSQHRKSTLEKKIHIYRLYPNHYYTCNEFSEYLSLSLSVRSLPQLFFSSFREAQSWRALNQNRLLFIVTLPSLYCNSLSFVLNSFVFVLQQSLYCSSLFFVLQHSIRLCCNTLFLVL